MNKYTVIFIYLLMVLFMAGCVAKKKYVSESFISERDSVSYVLPSQNELTIHELCDTLKVTTPILLKSEDGPVRTEVRAEGNSLVVKTEYDTIFKDRIVEKEVVKNVEKETVKFKWSKITWLFLGIIILFMIAPAIPYTINKVIFRGLL